MQINVQHFENSCSFDFAFDGDPEWSRCTAVMHPAPSHPFRLDLSYGHYGDFSYVVTPLKQNSWVLYDPLDETSCRFDPSGCVDDIASEIEESIFDEELACLVAYAIVSLCREGLE